MLIGFVGLGNMGAPMVRNLLRAGHRVAVFDLSEKACLALVEDGAQRAESPKHAALDAEIVITMLPAAMHVRKAVLGDGGVLQGMAQGAILIDSSTIDPQTAQDVSRQAQAAGVGFLDAPVSGGTNGANKGTLTFMVGGEAEVLSRATPVLMSMGKNVVHCGAAGMGQVAKLCNNLLLGITMAGVAEALSLGASLGIDATLLSSIMNTSTGRSWSSDSNNPFPGVMENVPASRGYSGGFGTDLMLKDLGLATDAARAAKHPVFMGALAQQLYQSLSSHGDGGLDFSAIIRLYRETDE